MRNLISGSTREETFREVYLVDPRYCNWTVRQDKPPACKLKCFKHFVRRMDDLTQKNDGIREKANEVERQLRG